MIPSAIELVTYRLVSVNYATVYPIPVMDVSKIWQH